MVQRPNPGQEGIGADELGSLLGQVRHLQAVLVGPRRQA
jgi:hypothetical protein